MSRRDDPVEAIRTTTEVPTWLEALHAAVVAQDASAVSTLTQASPDGAKVNAIKRGLELLEALRRSTSSQPAANSLDTPSTPFAKGQTTIPSQGQLGQRIGRFEIERELGSGGHGIVFLAQDTALGRKVALKVPRIEAVTSRELRSRFVSEARAAAQLSHPNIIAVHEVGDLGPLCYIAEEYCPGPTLATWMGQQANSALVSPTSAAELIAALADGVSHAHAHGILHRDLKPSNVLLMPIGDGPENDAAGKQLGFTPKLSDFGLARLDEADRELTHTGALVGTPAYMPPEQAEGRTRDVDVRSDVYGLGAVLYELLSGRPPFQGGTPLETMRRVVADDPRSPSSQGRKVPADLEAICMKCLEKTPERRYASAADLASDLRRFLRGEPTAARALPWHQRVLKWSRRRPLVAAMLGVILAAGISLASVVTVYTWRLARALTAAEEQRAEAVAERQEAAHQRDVARAAEAMSKSSQRDTRLLLYAADMRLADEAYRSANPREALAILRRYLPQDGAEDLREFAWRYLWERCDRRLLTLRGHQGAVYWAGYSHDGTRVATAGQDGTIRTWNAITGEELSVFGGRKTDINSLSFAPDDRTLASAESDGSVRIWDVASGNEIKSLGPSEGEVFAVSFSPTGRWLASAGMDNQIRLWNVGDWSLETTLNNHTDFVHSVTFAPDEKTLASSGDDGVAYIWDLESKQPRHKLVGQCGSIYSICFSPLGSQLATAGQDGQVILWNCADGRELLRIKAHETRATSVAFSLDGRRLLTAGRDQRVHLWDSLSAKRLSSFEGHSDRVWHSEFSPDGREFVTGSSDRTAKLCKLSEPVDILPQYYIDRGQVVVTDDGVLHAVSRAGVEARQLAIYRDNSQQVENPHFTASILSTAMSRTGTIATAVDAGGNLAVWQPNKSWRTIASHVENREATQIADTACGPVAAMGNSSSTMLSVIHLLDGHQVFRTECSLGWFKFSGDGSRLVTGLLDGTVLVWDTVTWTEVFRWKFTESSAMSDGVLSKDGSLLAVGFHDGHTRVLDLTQRSMRFDLASHPVPVRSLVFSDDSSNLATAAEDNSVLVWDLRTGRTVMLINGPPNLSSLQVFTRSELIGITGEGDVVRWTAYAGEPIDNRTARLDPTGVNPTFSTATRADYVSCWPILPFGEPARVLELSKAFARFARLSAVSTSILRPTFDDQESNECLLVGAIEIKNARDEVGAFSGVADGRSYAHLTQEADAHTKRIRQSAGYPFLYENRFNSIMMLAPESFERRQVPASELGDIETETDRFREIHRWAKRNGFVSGYPTFDDDQQPQGTVYGAVLIKPGFGKEIFLPASEVWPDASR